MEELDRRRFLALLAGAAASACASEAVDLDRATGTTASSTASSTAPSTATTTAPSTATTTAPVATEPSCPPIPERLGPDPARPRQRVEASVDPVGGVVEGALRVEFTPDIATDVVVFRLWPNGPRPARAGARLEVGAASLDGAPVTGTQPAPTHLELHPDGALAAGRTVTVDMPFRLTVPGSVQDRISHDGDSLRLGSFFPLLAWQPGIGWATEPPTSGFAEAATSPASDFVVDLNVSDGFGVLASALPSVPGHYEATAVRDFAVTVGRFDEVRATADAGRPVEVVVGAHPGGGTPGPYLDKVVAVLEDFARRYGPYPWPAYTLSLTPGLRGGIEFPGHVMQGPDTIGRTTSHEVAHMWFYGLVGSNQGLHPWIDEGLASWAEARYENTLGQFRSRAVAAAGRGRAGEPMTYWEQNQSAYYRAVYVQSAVALGELGPPDLVDCALAHYVAANAHRIVGPEEVFASLNAAFPEPEPVLAPFGITP